MHEERKKLFWSKVDVLGEDDCWEWLAAKNRKGYGRFLYKFKDTGAHRISYLITYGSIPAGKLVMHLCNNPGCVNPRHLEAGTQKENMRYAVECGRIKIRARCEHGHEFTEETIYINPSGDKSCKICRRDAYKRILPTRNEQLRKKRQEIFLKIKLAGHCV